MIKNENISETVHHQENIAQLRTRKEHEGKYAGIISYVRVQLATMFDVAKYLLVCS